MKDKSPKPIASKPGIHAAAAASAAAGQTAFEALETELLALPKDQLRTARVDVQVAAITALGVARAVDSDAALRRRFEGLASVKELDIAKLDSLATTALAAWYARHMVLLTSAAHSDAQLPVSLVTTASQVKTRMMRVVEYHLADHDVAGPIVDAIRPGVGYLDLANDLVALARLYADYRARLEHDKKDYQPADAALAAKLGDEIITLLGGGTTPEQRVWIDRQARAWTKLEADYAEVFAAGRFLKRHDDDAATAFPSLIAAARATARAAADPPAPPPPSPAAPPPAPAPTGA